MAARAKKGGFQSNMIGLFLGRSSTKIAQIVLHKMAARAKKKTEKTSNDISAVTT